MRKGDLNIFTAGFCAYVVLLSLKEGDPFSIFLACAAVAINLLCVRAVRRV